MSSNTLPFESGQVSTSLERRARAYLVSRVQAGSKVRQSDIITVTPEIAAEMLLRNKPNRAVKDKNVRKYADLMRRGEWKLTAQGVSFSRCGRLLDGQHRLLAIVMSGVSVRMTLWFGCEESEFEVIDQGSARTAGDLLSIVGMESANSIAALAGMVLRVRHRIVGSIPHQDTLHFAQENAAAMHEAVRASMKATKIRSKSACALAYFHLREKYEAHTVEPFWEALCSGENQRRGSPILRVRDQLLAPTKVGYHLTRETSVKMAAAIIMAWNAYRRDKRLTTTAWPHVVQLPEVE
jgi:hypothetical protein